MPDHTAPAATETVRIADQLRRVYEGNAWLGPSLKELLSGIDETHAARQPIPRAHSIWELVLHITAWMRIARERLSADKLRDHNDEENWPSATGPWKAALTGLDQEARDLERAILSFPPDRLKELAPATEPQTYYVLLHGVVQHAAYHAGQIALLKKEFPEAQPL
jgi:uncharacterized damage-inducible protein DinB